jgi:hypothetical protein
MLIVVTIWSILVAPGLCSAGWIDHLCADHEDAACEHETDCMDDPCESPSLRPGSSGTDVMAAPVAAILPGFELSFEARPATFLSPDCAPAHAPPSSPTPLRL